MRPRGSWVWPLAAVSVLLAYGVVVIVPAARNPDTNGFATYYTAARILVESPADLPRVYDDAWFQSQIDAFGFRHVVDVFAAQPPTMALFMAPLSGLAPRAAR